MNTAVQRAAHAYLVTPPLEMLTDLVQLRDALYAQLDRTRKPHQQAELYMLAGQVCGLLSSVSFDLGHTSVAEEQARTAYTYGSVIDHPSLCAWARALQVAVTFWSGQPRRAVAIAESALVGAPVGTARVRLHAVRARALIGARDEVGVELAAAAGQLDLTGDDEHLDGTGGELAFDRSRHALCVSSAYVALADGERAETAALEALEIFAGLDDQQRWGRRCCLRSGGPRHRPRTPWRSRRHRGRARRVLALPTGERTEAVSQRLFGLGRILGSPRHRGAIEATRLGESIESFTSAASRVPPRPAIGAA